VLGGRRCFLAQRNATQDGRRILSRLARRYRAVRPSMIFSSRAYVANGRYTCPPGCLGKAIIVGRRNRKGRVEKTRCRMRVTTWSKPCAHGDCGVCRRNVITALQRARWFTSAAGSLFRCFGRKRCQTRRLGKIRSEIVPQSDGGILCGARAERVMLCWNAASWRLPASLMRARHNSLMIFSSEKYSAKGSIALWWLGW